MKIAITIHQFSDDGAEITDARATRAWEVPKDLGEKESRHALVRIGTSVFTALEEYRRADVGDRPVSIETLNKEGFEA